MFTARTGVDELAKGGRRHCRTTADRILVYRSAIMMCHSFWSPPLPEQKILDRTLLSLKVDHDLGGVEDLGPITAVLAIMVMMV